MRIVVSGATSMIGASLVNRLVGQGHDVIAIVRNECTKLDVLKADEHLKIINCDMQAYDKLDSIIKQKIDVAVALAWNGTRGNLRNDESLQLENFQNNKKYLQAMIRLKCKKFFTAGSQAEYGVWTEKEKITEDVSPNPNTEYGKYKLRFYEYAKSYCSMHDCDLVEPRFFSLYGPDDFQGTLIISMLKKMLANEPCDLTECIQQWDFLYIDDAIDALCMLIESKTSNGIYNFGSGHSAMLKDYIEIMMQITNSKSELNYGAVPYPKTGIVNVNPDIEKLKKTGWTAHVTFEEGIRKIIKIRFL